MNHTNHEKSISQNIIHKSITVRRSETDIFTNSLIRIRKCYLLYSDGYFMNRLTIYVEENIPVNLDEIILNLNRICKDVNFQNNLNVNYYS